MALSNPLQIFRDRRRLIGVIASILGLAFGLENVAGAQLIACPLEESGAIYQTARAENGDLWVASSRGVFALRAGNEESVQDKPARAIAWESGGGVWLASAGKILGRPVGSIDQRPQPIQLELPADLIISSIVREEAADTFWIGTKNRGLFEARPSGPKQHLQDQDVLVVEQAPSEYGAYVYVGTDRAAFRSTASESFEEILGVDPNNGGVRQFEIGYETVWILAKLNPLTELGALYWVPQNEESDRLHARKVTGLSGIVAMSFLGESVAVATTGGLFVVEKEDTPREIWRRPDIKSLQRRGDELWIGTAEGLFRWQITSSENVVVEPYPEFWLGRVDDIAEMGEGDDLWFRSGSKICRVSSRGGIKARVRSSVSNDGRSLIEVADVGYTTTGESQPKPGGSFEVFVSGDEDGQGLLTGDPYSTSVLPGKKAILQSDGEDSYVFIKDQLGNMRRFGPVAGYINPFLTFALIVVAMIPLVPALVSRERARVRIIMQNFAWPCRHVRRATTSKNGVYCRIDLRYLRGGPVGVQRG